MASAAWGPPQPVLKRCRTDGFAAYSVAFSPFFPNKLAAAGSANFGLVGNGRLTLLNTATPALEMATEKTFDTQDGLYDVSWSEIHENQLVTASGDGSVKLWDAVLNDFPIRKWHEHSREVFSVDWSNVQKELFCTASWDTSIKLWTPDRPTSLMTIPAHTACVYSAVFAPSAPNTIASCSTDGFLKVWDTRHPQPPNASSSPQIAIQAHPTEVLSLDWNKYLPHLIVTGSVDRSIRIHDLRMASTTGGLAQAQASASSRSVPSPTVASLLGHDYAVRKVAWSPHSPDVLASASYDMSARVWSVDAASLGNRPMTTPFGQAGLGGARYVRRYDAHTEFVVGLAWSLYEENRIATASWDQQIHIW